MKPGQKHYSLRAHSLRKFYKTQLVAKDVPESHVDYMMGHVTDTYNQVQALGVDKLRETYARAQLTIRPQPQQSLTRTLIQLIQAAGKDPQQYLTREAFTDPHKTRATPETLDQREARILLSALTEHLREQLLSQRS